MFDTTTAVAVSSEIRIGKEGAPELTASKENALCEAPNEIIDKPHHEIRNWCALKFESAPTQASKRFGG
jgi:hypothetical protein